MKYLNLKGHNWGNYLNLDGYGISLLVFAGVYTLILYAACLYVWSLRKHPIVKMRNIGLTITSLLVLHVYLFMIFMIYPVNGAFPCSVEFWIMSLYLPIGFGLFQAQNQQLLIVSRGQQQLAKTNVMYKPLGTGRRGLEGWIFRLKVWWNDLSTEGKYESFVAIGIGLQFAVSLIIYCVSRKWISYGRMSHHTTPGLCRRGWEWVPSIVWQSLWNYVFGPALLWKMRNIHDVYHWRLQTTLSILAGLPGTPLWLAALYSDKFAAVNKYVVPAMWFVPGMLTMQAATLAFPILQIWKAKRAAKKSGTYTMSSLNSCLGSDYDALLDYTTTVSFNGENIVFLTRVLAFEKTWNDSLANTSDDLERRARVNLAMFRSALSIYISLVYSDTATWPINVDYKIYNNLERIFGEAAKIVAARRPASRATSTSVVSPWDDPIRPIEADPLSHSGSHTSSPAGEAYPMGNMGRSHSQTRSLMSTTGESEAHIIPNLETDGDADPSDPLNSFLIPEEFDIHCFEAAYKSIQFMVWSQTWQDFNKRKRASNTGHIV